MYSRRWMSLALVMASALPWSLSLGVLGVWLIAEPHAGVLGHRVLATSAGAAALCGAQIVFLMCIADRVFPRAHRVISRTIQSMLGVIFLGSTGVLAVVSVMQWGA